MTWSYWDGGSSWDGGSWQIGEWREDQQWWKGETWRQRTPDSSYQSSSQCQWQGAKPDSQWQGTKPDSQWHDSNNLWQGQGNKAAQYASVTTLGLKNPLPLDERRELLLELIALGTDRGGTSFSADGSFQLERTDHTSNLHDLVHGGTRNPFSRSP